MRACDVAADGSETSSVTASVEGRYASALYDLATEQGQVAEVEGHLTAFQNLLSGSNDLQRMIKSPVFSAEEQAGAMSAILEKVGISGVTANFFALVAKNRRLFAIPGIIKAFKQLAASGRGEVTAQVTSAAPLTDEQVAALRTSLRAKVGKDVVLDQAVDPEILGGLIVKVGSRMVDNSLRTKLNAMKVGLKKSAA